MLQRRDQGLKCSAHLSRVSPVELLDPLEPVVELPELVGAAEGGDLLFPQPVLVVIDLPEGQRALVIPGAIIMLNSIYLSEDIIGRVSPLEHGALPVLAVDGVLVGLLLAEALLHQGIHQPLQLLVIPPLLLQ